MKVALISKEFPPFAFGGVASNCYDLAHSLARSGVDTTVFCGRSKQPTVERPAENLKVVRLPLVDLPHRGLWFQLLNIDSFLRCLKKYSVLHFVDPESGGAWAYFRKRFGVPVVTSIHEHVLLASRIFLRSPLAEWTLGDFGYHVVEYPLNEFLLRACMASSDHLIVHGQTTLEDMKQTYRHFDFEKATVIHNGVNFDKMPGIDPRLMPGRSDRLTVAFFGRLFWRKGILHLLRAFAVLQQDFPNLKLNIFGTGPLQTKLTRLIGQLGLSDNVRMGGYIAYADLLKEIAKADIISLPSLYEVGPYIAALEAMACRKPVVAFDFPFVREFMTHMQNALVAKPGDVEDLSQKIRQLVVDGGLRLRVGVDAYQYVKERHNWNLLVQRFLQVYQNVL